MKNNEYLESYKIQVVRKVMSGASLKKTAEELGIAKSTLWGWKCKYAALVAPEFAIKEENKPERFEDFVDVTLASKETKEKPSPRYINPTTVSLEIGEYRLSFDVTNLNKVLEVLGHDRS